MDLIPTMSSGSVAVESWVRARHRPWAQTLTTCWAAGFSTPGGRRVTWPSGKAPFWSAWPWTAPSTWSNMTALIACTASSSSKTTGCPTCRCCQRKSVSYLLWMGVHFVNSKALRSGIFSCFILVSTSSFMLCDSQYLRDHFAIKQHYCLLF